MISDLITGKLCKWINYWVVFKTEDNGRHFTPHSVAINTQIIICERMKNIVNL